MSSAHRFRGLLTALALAGVAAALPAAATRSAAAPTIRCHALDAPAAPAAGTAAPAGFGGCPGVRPGAQVVTPVGSCTLAFLFAGSDGARYAATAGHCLLGNQDARRTWAPGAGPVAKNSDGRVIGRGVYAVLKQGSGDAVDFALIRLDRGVAASPQMCHFGGPTAYAQKRDTAPLVSNDPVELRLYGRGFATVPARTLVSPQGYYRPDYIYAFGVAYAGDSGAPVVDSVGAAAGIVTQLVYGPAGNVGLNPVAPNVVAAERALRLRLTLLTAPVL